MTNGLTETPVASAPVAVPPRRPRRAPGRRRPRPEARGC